MNTAGVTFTIRAVDTASAVFNKIKQSLGGLKSKAIAVIGSLKNMFAGLARSVMISMGVGTAGVVAMFGLMTRNAISLASDYEQATIAFTGMLGGKDAAQSLLNTLEKFAAVTPFEFPQLVSATRLLTAYGYAADQLIPTLTAVGNAVSGLGGGAETLDRVMRAMGQIKSKGFLSGEEARQMAEAGINVYQMVAEALNVTIPQAMDLSSKKIINADTALEAMVQGMNRRFPNMMAMQSKTLQGVTSTLKDVFDMGLRKIGETMTGKLTAMATGLANIIEMVFSEENIAKFSGFIDKIFNRESIAKVATWLANVFIWSRDVFQHFSKSGIKAVNWVTDSFRKMKDYISKHLVPTLISLSRIFFVLKGAELGVNTADTMIKIAGFLAPVNAVAAGVAAASALPLGIAAGAAVATAGNIAVNKAEALMKKMRRDLDKEGIPEFPAFGDEANQGAGEIVNAFMSAFDETAAASPLTTAAQQTAQNTGLIADQTKQTTGLLANIFGNSGDRMKTLATRARFGNLAERGGGLNINVTVASQKDADNLRYALNYAAGLAR